MTLAELAAAGFELSADEHARLDRYVRLLLDENTRLNLTGTRDAADFWRAHVCDSLALLPLIGEREPRTLLDLGTGGGLPGIPLACVCPELSVTLMDSTQKKLVALERVIAALELENAVTLCGRAEALAHDPKHRESFDAVVVRAVGDLRICIEYAAGFVKPGGQAWFYRSCQSAEQDVTPAEHAASRCRMTRVETRIYALPGPHGERAFVIYRKDRDLPKSLPRAVGKPKLQPL
ncbi:MAG: 16S rRNA (guanine(527)-N(7))-methyltransferase RsmG [Phycisphaerae bacterium]|nr:16S rRNA (guanine(527)-N(7))-methyltransferase RsmG [Phycisphaerae bacterium]